VLSENWLQMLSLILISWTNDFVIVTLDFHIYYFFVDNVEFIYRFLKLMYVSLQEFELFI